MVGVPGMLYRISGEENTEVEPEIGQKIFFLLKDHKKESDMFIAHYLCMDPSFVIARWDKKNENETF